MTKIQGIITHLSQNKGFGFITPADGTEDIFFHCTAIQTPNKTVVEGQVVEFELQDQAGRIEAINIKDFRYDV
ncbi:cold shock domain-containing protein [Cyanothece sp. BG0011]|uniref:cold shock domain-containing protein n=1 Tax=Cyanothece sp. BG0011 TaxID=2082950 RepID=UPI000D1DE82D|nr:cold shock domain-containing protein [Cyanothece sp. BG0011]